MQTKAEADRASNERLVAALFDGVAAEEQADTISQEVSSHKQVQLDENGDPVQLRFAFVDEAECIGCTYCADVARGTFFMNEDAGRARVFNQGGDAPEQVVEAIECCPVNCISFVDYEDLCVLETERDGVTIIRNAGLSKIGDACASNAVGYTASKAKSAGGSMMCCNNCPSKGCKECP